MKGQLSQNRNLFPPGITVTLAPDLSRVSELKAEHEPEALKFLAIRPVHTVVMTGFIQDNGIDSPFNRGKFYGHRNEAGELDGVALIGHSTLVEARSEEALEALAFAARSSTIPMHLIMSGGDVATAFWNYMYAGSRRPSLVCTELLFEARFPFPAQPCAFPLRKARVEELEPIVAAQAEIAELECGINPLDRDPEGFRQRVLRRIAQGRVYVAFEGSELVFKTDVMSETETVAYLEGVYVSALFRGKGIGSQCLSRLCIDLLGRVQTVCLFSNANFKLAHRTFMRAGMRSTDACTTLFV